MLKNRQVITHYRLRIIKRKLAENILAICMAIILSPVYKSKPVAENLMQLKNITIER